MPVKKSKKKKTRSTSSAPKSETNILRDDFVQKIFITVIGVLLVYLVFFVGTLIRNNIAAYYTIGMEDQPSYTMNFEASEKITARPDVATTRIGMVSSGQSVSEAQQNNTAVMNTLIERLRELGVAEEDIQTQGYNISPQYQYSEEDGRTLQGYDVSQQVKVKIRDLEKSNQILALAGEVGANSVSGLEFSIDDPEIYRNEARQAAMKKAIEKAKRVAGALDVDLLRVVGYHESFNGETPGPMYRDEALGMGSGAPQVESGSMEVVANVNVVFAIR